MWTFKVSTCNLGLLWFVRTKRISFRPYRRNKNLYLREFIKACPWSCSTSRELHKMSWLELPLSCFINRGDASCIATTELMNLFLSTNHSIFSNRIYVQGLWCNISMDPRWTVFYRSPGFLFVERWIYA